MIPQSCCNTNNNKHSHHNEKVGGHHDSHEHSHDDLGKSNLQLFLPAIISFTILLAGIALDNFIKPDWFSGWWRAVLYVAAYIPVGLPVMREAAEGVGKGDFFSEFFLMCIATIGAFAIGEYPEGVAVMLFYAVGEVFQSIAVTRAQNNIKSLLDQRPDEVTIIENNQQRTIKAELAEINQVIQLRPGEKLALDGALVSDAASFNTAALTGESKPDTKRRGDAVLAGMINLNSVSQVKVTAGYKDSKLSKILELVQNATSQKAPTELFIRRFAKIYTPIVVLLAAAICLLPYFILQDYNFRVWLYRALVFLVISCPCALVISIPLGYFGGIGAGSRKGVLFKGGNFLDVLAKIQNVVVDKTGTMTEGVFKVQNVFIQNAFGRQEILRYLNAVESKSTHPIATAVHQYAGEVDAGVVLDNVEEISGHGMYAEIDGKIFLAGNYKLLDKFRIPYTVEDQSAASTVIALAYGGMYAGYITISDRVKDDAEATVEALKKMGVKITMLSGDKTAVVKEVAEKIGIQNYFGDLLPEDKVAKVQAIKASGESVAFVGDGVNDAPVVALSDVGIAMGGLGSDATIETADVVIQDDKPSKIPIAIQIGEKTKSVVWQNIILAFSVKALVLVLGAGGLATMWEAVFADVGVALLAILNAMRIQRI